MIYRDSISKEFRVDMHWTLVFNNLKLSIGICFLFLTESWRWGVAENFLGFYRHSSWWSFINDKGILFLNALKTILRQTPAKFWKPLLFRATSLRLIFWLWCLNGYQAIELGLCFWNDLRCHVFSHTVGSAKRLFRNIALLSCLSLRYSYCCLYRLMMGDDTRLYLENHSIVVGSRANSSLDACQKRIVDRIESSCSSFPCLLLLNRLKLAINVSFYYLNAKLSQPCRKFNIVRLRADFIADVNHLCLIVFLTVFLSLGLFFLFLRPCAACAAKLFT